MESGFSSGVLPRVWKGRLKAGANGLNKETQIIGAGSRGGDEAGRERRNSALRRRRCLLQESRVESEVAFLSMVDELLLL